VKVTVVALTCKEDDGVGCLLDLPILEKVD